MKNSLLVWAAALCCVMMSLSTGTALAERRVALVVGNAEYKNPALNLANPKNDAEDVAAALRSLDFEVILSVNATKRDLDVAMTQFARAATGADAALFFYAGHALQYQGRNYMMPIDGEFEDEISLRYQMTLLDDVRAGLERADGVKIIILDACRNNPVVDDMRRKAFGSSRSLQLTRGLARMDKALGMVVAYATAADDVAADGAGRNSPFSTALLRRLQEPGLEIGSMFRRIAADVSEKTNGRQRPETYVSLIGEYYLNQKDRLAWDQVKDSTDPTALRSFITRFPTSPRASDAQYRLQLVERFTRDQPARVPAETAIRPPVEQNTPPVAVAPPVVAALPPVPALLPPAAQPSVTPPAPLVQDQSCRTDEEKLARVRASQSREDVLRLEAELRCERLRQQVVRLRESLSAAAALSQPGQSVGAPSSNPLPVPPQPQMASPQLEQTCKRDQEKLVRLRANPVREEVARFERELACARLRPQLARLRESVGND